MLPELPISCRKNAYPKNGLLPCGKKLPIIYSLKEMKIIYAVTMKKNIPIASAIQLNRQKFSMISGAMMVEIAGKEDTLQQATAHLESTERPFR